MNLQAPDTSYEERKKRIQETIDKLEWKPLAAGGVATEFHFYTYWRIVLRIPDEAEMDLGYYSETTTKTKLISVHGVDWSLRRKGQKLPVACAREFTVETAVNRAVETALGIAEQMKDDSDNHWKLGKLLQEEE